MSRIDAHAEVDHGLRRKGSELLMEANQLLSPIRPSTSLWIGSIPEVAALFPWLHGNHADPSDYTISPGWDRTISRPTHTLPARLLRPMSLPTRAYKLSHSGTSSDPTLQYVEQPYVTTANIPSAAQTLP
ncbi:hypothetical protein BJY52DRAFT_1193201 [Lactarius psammicola]|nr:hypothetical protein BJY52DRAFT_1193201 [Lactarius psammicola]